MSLDDLTTPVVADQLATFGPGSAGKAAQLNYNVPLPGSCSWDRVVDLDLPEDWFADGSAQSGTSLIDLGVVQGDEGVVTQINQERLAQFIKRSLPASARPSLTLVADVGGDVSPLLGTSVQRVRALAENGDGGGALERVLERRKIANELEDVAVQRERIDSYIDRVAQTQSAVPTVDRRAVSLVLPTPGVGDSIRPITVNPVARAVPRIALVETWELRSFLGDYGLGRTLQTFSLLPGERTTITTQTWRTEAATREDASSIFDSSDTAAQTRFTSSLMNETGSASQDQGGWALSVSTSAQVGFNVGVVNGQFGLNAGFAANHQEASQRWSNQVSSAAAEHAAQVNNSRRQSVEASSSTSTSSGTSTTTVREIANINLRRVLNFVFRELNQTYETYVGLRDIKVAFYNGRPGSVDVVALPDLAALLRRHVAPAQQVEVARFVLSMCAQRLDASGELVTILQTGERPNGVAYQWSDAQLEADGTLRFAGDPLAPNVRWRMKTGSLSKDDRSVRGVIMDKSSIVLRTDNIVVEALLGQADALDPYATALQTLDLKERESVTRARDIQTDRVNDARNLVAAQAADQRVDAWQKLFPDEPEIQVVPVASVTTNGSTP